MSKRTFTTITGLALPLALLTACSDQSDAGPDAELELNEHFQISALEIVGSDGPILLQPLELELAADVSAAAFETNINVGLRSSDGTAGCVLGAVDIEAGDELDPTTIAAGELVPWSTRTELLVDGTCAKLAGREDVELFVAFDPWNKLEGGSFVDRLDGDPSTPIFELVADRMVSVVGCDSCETRYTVHDPVGLDAQLRELRLSSVVAVLPDADEETRSNSDSTPDFYLSAASRVTGLDKSLGLADGRVHFEHRLRPLGSSDEGLPLLQQRGDSGLTELEPVAVAGPMVINTVSALHIEGATRAALIDGAWSEIEEFELVTCLVTDFEQAVFVGETEPRANDCGSIPVVIVRGEEPVEAPSAAKLRSAEVYSKSWGVDAEYGFGYSGLGFKTWVDINGSDLPTTTYNGIEVSSAGSWFEAGVIATATVFDQPISLVDIYGTFIGYHWGGGKMAMKASLFNDDFIPEFELALEDGEPLTLQAMLDAANVGASPEVTWHVDLIGKSFNDGCDTVGAGLYVAATVGIDTEETSITTSRTDQGVEVSGTIAPFFDISAVAFANSGSFLGISLGIEVALTLLNVTVPFTAAVEVIDYDPLDAVRLHLSETVGAVFTTLSGYIKFSFEYDGFWGNVTHDHYIATWDGLSEYVQFFSANQNIHLGSETPGDFCTAGGSNDELLVGDYNGDGNLDYLCHNRSTGGEWIDFGPSFGGTDWDRGDANWCIDGDAHVGDFNGDGRDDILCNTVGGKPIDYADQNGQFWGIDWWGGITGYCAPKDGLAGTLSYLDLNGDGRDDMHCHLTEANGGGHMIDYADQYGHFDSIDWVGMQDPTSFCGRYDGQTIALQTYHGRYLSALPAAQGSGYTQTTTLGAAERFVVQCVDDKAALRTTYGTYVQPLDAANDYVCKQQTFIGTWEQLTALELSDGKWGFATIHGRYLMAGDAGWGYGLVQAPHVITWESFTVVPQ